MKFVYVLTGDKNIYFGVTIISALFLRRLHRDAEIILLTDTRSYHLYRDDSLIRAFDRCVIMDTPYTDPLYSSRFIRCNMRKLIDGDMVYLDSDTLPRKSLSEIFTVRADLAAALNHNKGIFDPSVEPENGALTSFGWRLEQNRYLNAGVQFWKDTDNAKRLSEKWLSNWLMFSDSRSHHDQIAFNAAVCSSEAMRIHVLDNSYNLQIKSCTQISQSASAHLWHYYMSDSDIPALIRRYLSILEKDKTLSEEMISEEQKRDVPLDYQGHLNKHQIDVLLYKETAPITIREKMLDDLKEIVKHKRVAVFGAGLSGSMTHDFLTGYLPAKKLIIIDDARTEPLKGTEIITTDKFLSDTPQGCGVIVCGRHQKLNPRLNTELTIPLIRLQYVE